jgi:hypothetical protein
MNATSPKVFNLRTEAPPFKRLLEATMLKDHHSKTSLSSTYNQALRFFLHKKMTHSEAYDYMHKNGGPSCVAMEMREIDKIEAGLNSVKPLDENQIQAALSNQLSIYQSLCPSIANKLAPLGGYRIFVSRHVSGQDEIVRELPYSIQHQIDGAIKKFLLTDFLNTSDVSPIIRGVAIANVMVGPPSNLELQIETRETATEYYFSNTSRTEKFGKYLVVEQASIPIGLEPNCIYQVHSEILVQIEAAFREVDYVQQLGISNKSELAMVATLNGQPYQFPIISRKHEMSGVAKPVETVSLKPQHVTKGSFNWEIDARTWLKLIDDKAKDTKSMTLNKSGILVNGKRYELPRNYSDTKPMKVDFPSAWFTSLTKLVTKLDVEQLKLFAVRPLRSDTWPLALQFEQNNNQYFVTGAA